MGQAKTNGASGAVVVFDASKFQATVANMAKGAHSQVGFLKMDKTGVWSWGQDEVPVREDDPVYVDPMGFVHGWQCWADTELPGVEAELLGDVVAPMFEPLPERPSKVPENGRPWGEMRGLSAMVEGQRLVYSTTSVGGLKAIASLAEEYAAQFTRDKTKMIAVLSLSSDSYKHKNKTYGRVYIPVFTVKKWVGKLPEDAVAPAAPAAPAKKADTKRGAAGRQAANKDKAPAKAPAKTVRRAI